MGVYLPRYLLGTGPLAIPWDESGWDNYDAQLKAEDSSQAVSRGIPGIVLCCFTGRVQTNQEVVKGLWKYTIG